MTRRTFLASAASAAASSDRAIERAHEEMWARFIDKDYGTLYDYAPFKGKVDLPTPEDCRDLKPNGMAWWTPVENGGFFGGLYLSALCGRWNEQKSRKRADEAHTIANGLVRLARIGSTPGFIARGISTDGKSHYPPSSSDQTYPWFYGMYCYLTTTGLVPEGSRRQELIRLVEEKADALHALEWRIPSDRQGFGYFGEWLGAFSDKRTTLTGAEPQFDAAARVLFIHAAMHRLTGKKVWHDRYLQLRDEKPEGTQFSRLDICSQGVEYAPPATPARYPKHPPIWTSASSQAALHALAALDPGRSASYRSGMKVNAGQAMEWIERYKLFDNVDASIFRHDWRFLNDLWVPQSSVPEAVTLATKQVREWHKQSPRKVYECENVRDALFSAWVVALAGDKSALQPALEHYRWDRMHTSHFFAAECARYASEIR